MGNEMRGRKEKKKWRENNGKMKGRKEKQRGGKR